MEYYKTKLKSSGNKLSHYFKPS